MKIRSSDGIVSQTHWLGPNGVCEYTANMPHMVDLPLMSEGQSFTIYNNGPAPIIVTGAPKGTINLPAGIGVTVKGERHV